MQKQKNPFSLMAFIRPHRAGFITAIVLAVLSVASGIVPYFAVARMVNLLISGEKNFLIYLIWGAVALITYLLKSVLHGISTRCSHEAMLRPHRTRGAAHGAKYRISGLHHP